MKILWVEITQFLWKTLFVITSVSFVIGCIVLVCMAICMIDEEKMKETNKPADLCKRSTGE